MNVSSGFFTHAQRRIGTLVAKTTIMGTMALAALSLTPPSAHAQLLNGAFTIQGANGPAVALTGPSGSVKESAAKYWYQFVAVPNSTIYTTLTTAQNKKALYIQTTAGFYPPVQMGNGIVQTFPTLVNGAVAGFDILVANGQVTGGLIKTSGPFAQYATFKPMAVPKWHHHVETETSPVFAMAFENLAAGVGDTYFLANAWVQPLSSLRLVDVTAYTKFVPDYTVCNPGGPPVVRAHVINTGTQTLTGPLNVLVHVRTAGRALTNEDGDFNGVAYVALPVRSLIPGASANVTLQFDATTDGACPEYMVSVDSGIP